ncbi:unnamed protein product [Euphydryas editha]|uniref:Uncharacterized protein n=1 Tax=Euphydryas editha TaxID=104508 RepID=A0AAU9UPW3_EUPED|nr:unnamed protein product [Euphydryas editha]
MYRVTGKLVSIFKEPTRYMIFIQKRGGDQQSQDVGFMRHGYPICNIISVAGVSNRVAYLILRVSEGYSLAPASAHADDEVEDMYEDVSRAANTNKTYSNIILVDFNEKIVKGRDDELRVGQFGYGKRNHRGQRLADLI